MRRKVIYCDSIQDAVDEIFLNYLKHHASDESYFELGQNYYFDGWYGLGASAVLAAIAELARSQLQEPSRFDIVIHVDCSVWESRRTLQRRIAEELKLDRSAMELFDEQDDFSGVDKSDRAEIAHVANLVYDMTKARRLLVIFYNGSDDEIDLARFGLPVFNPGNMVLWTFQGRFRLDPAVGEKVKSAHCFIDVLEEKMKMAHYYINPNAHMSWTFDLLVLEEASQLRPDISPTLMADCWFYWCLLYFDHDNLIDYDEYAHASNCWVCDGIIPDGDSAWQIGETLQQALRLDFIPTKENNRVVSHVSF
uniref:Uncharacterized protein n=1 Tax=Avena sativa TaxID=4498 RepID=A0ACD5Y1T7_AVESA